LKISFPQSSSLDGRWVYYPESANPQKIDNPEVSKVIPEFSFYQVLLTNYLGYHINKSYCLVLFDTVRSKAIGIVPMWYEDISESLLKLFIGKKFSDSTAVIRFAEGLEKLIMVGSTGKMENTRYAIDKVTFDMTYEGSKGTEVWRNIEMIISDNTIQGFISTNPKMKTSVTVK
ncbi:MAG: hypothetical protein ABI480_09985, partial [Chitinophagaceae bacterium]